MFYTVILPNVTRDTLNKLVKLQLDLLDYAATTTQAQWTRPDEETCIAHLQTACRTYLTNHCGSTQKQAQSIAQGFFHDKKVAGRIKLLKEFAFAYQHAPDPQKAIWRCRLRTETTALSTTDNASLSLGNFYDHGTNNYMKQMQQAAAAFLLYFYDTFLGDTSATIPGTFLTQQDGQPFGRQALIEAFHHTNPTLEICPFCDESRYYTQYNVMVKEGGEVVKKVRTHAILDHFFPKSRYPHLCCHPYNFIPVCYNCNSPVKREKDPFCHATGTPPHLPKATLPYHGARDNSGWTKSLKDSIYLAVRPGQKAELFSIEGLKLRPGEDDAALQHALDILQDVYNMPGRWSGEGQTLRIVDTVFRRMRHFLGNGTGNPLGTARADEIYNMLKELLYDLDIEDQQKDPFTFAMTWILVSILKTKHAPKGMEHAAWQAMVEEINSWFGQELAESQTRDWYVEHLIQVVP